MDENLKSVRDANVTIQWRRILEVREILKYLINEGVSESARDINVTVQLKRIVKAREVPT